MGFEDPCRGLLSPGMLLAASSCPCCPPADRTSSEMDSYPHMLLLCSLLPRPTRLVSLLWLQQKCRQTAMVGSTGHVPNPLPDRQSRPPTRVCPQGAPTPRGRARLTKEVSPEQTPSLKPRTPCSMEQSPLEAGRPACQGQRPGLAPGVATSLELTALLFRPPPPVSLPSRRWFWFFAHSYLFNKENSAVLREKSLHGIKHAISIVCFPFSLSLKV